MTQDFTSVLSSHSIEYLAQEPLSKHTSWKLGGPAELLVHVKSTAELKKVIQLANENNIPTVVLGGGSNVLVHDRGISGLVIMNTSRNTEILQKKAAALDVEKSEVDSFDLWIQPRHDEVGDDGFYTFKDLDYQDEGERVEVCFDSGVAMPYAIAWTLKNGITGLQWYGGIPGTIGGALFNNIHGGTKHFSDVVASATVLHNREVKTVDRDFFEFGYDQSILRTDSSIYVLDVTLKLYRGDVEKATYVAREWTKRKRRQPKVSSGCVFKNISLEKQTELEFPTPSVGYIIDKKLSLAGHKVGGVVISDQHANFFVNEGGGKASDVVELIKLVRQQCREKWNLELETEINLLGFTEAELADIRLES